MNQQQNHPYNSQQSSKNFNVNGVGSLQPHEEEEVRSIEKEANIKTVQHIKSQSHENNKYEGEEQDRLYGLRYLSIFQNELEKALIFVVGARHITNLN